VCAWSIWFDSLMENTLRRMAIGAAAVFAFTAVPEAAGAETVVPPGNSAATQYTETFPTPSGNAEVNSPISGGGRGGHHPSNGGGRSPEKVLGSDTAHQLEEHGQDGQSVATLATEAAPQTTGEGGGSGGSGTDGGATGKGAKGSGGSGSEKGAPSIGSGNGAPTTTDTALEVSAPAGSSGLSEVLSHATGSSSGEMGIFLPLVLLAVPLCALLYAWRRRHPGQAAS
jgi:hypothetical protein